MVFDEFRKQGTVTSYASSQNARNIPEGVRRKQVFSGLQEFQEIMGVTKVRISHHVYEVFRKVRLGTSFCRYRKIRRVSSHDPVFSNHRMWGLIHFMLIGPVETEHEV